MWAELKIAGIQRIKSRIWDMIDDWYINNLAKNQVSALFRTRVICRSGSPKFLELCMETPCLCPSEGHKHSGCKVTETSATAWGLPLKRKIIALEIRRTEINVSLSASTVQLAKTKAITLLFTSATAYSGRHFQFTQRKSFEIQTCFITKTRTLSS